MYGNALNSFIKNITYMPYILYVTLVDNIEKKCESLTKRISRLSENRVLI